LKRLKDINWNQVYCFFEVARNGSMKKASEVLSLSLPTVSEQIKRLEAMLDLQLFSRTGAGVELTADGAALFNCAKEMFSAGSRFLDNVSDLAIGGYATRVGIQESLSASVALDFVYRYWEVYEPYGIVNTYRLLYAEDLAHRIVRGDLDWGIMTERPRQARLSYYEIGTYDVVFCCAPELMRRFERREDILGAVPLAQDANDSQMSQAVLSHLQALGIAPAETFESDHRELCFGLAARGRCVTPIALGALNASPWRDCLEAFTVGGPVKAQFFVAWATASERMIAIRKLCEILKSEE
jgi:DNA-binding transcriptional LysR family regulator